MAMHLNEGENNKEINEKEDQVAFRWKPDVSTSSPIELPTLFRGYTERSYLSNQSHR